jgi:hypothetical protein
LLSLARGLDGWWTSYARQLNSARSNAGSMTLANRSSIRTQTLRLLRTNVRVQRSYETNGFVHEGVLRDGIRFDGAYQAGVIMSVLEENFRRIDAGDYFVQIGRVVESIEEPASEILIPGPPEVFARYSSKPEPSDFR